MTRRVSGAESALQYCASDDLRRAYNSSPAAFNHQARQEIEARYPIISVTVAELTGARHTIALRTSTTVAELKATVAERGGGMSVDDLQLVFDDSRLEHEGRRVGTYGVEDGSELRAIAKVVNCE